MIFKRKQYLSAFLFLLPALALYGFFLINPIIQSIYLSFFRWNGIASSAPQFIGFENYNDLLTSTEFWKSLLNSAWFIIGSFVIELPLAFIFALIVTSSIKGYRAFKVAYFLPVILPMTAVGLMWKFILYPNGGLVNLLLEKIGLIGISTTDWLGSPKTAIFSVVFVNMLIFAGLNMIIFAAGLVSIPDEIYQAVRIDGANEAQKMLYITVPMLRETFKIFAITAVTGSIRVFDIIYVMTGGGPNGASDVPATLLFFNAFRYNYFGYGSCIGTVILLISLMISVVLNKAMSKE